MGFDGGYEHGLLDRLCCRAVLESRQYVFRSWLSAGNELQTVVRDFNH